MGVGDAWWLALPFSKRQPRHFLQGQRTSLESVPTFPSYTRRCSIVWMSIEYYSLACWTCRCWSFNPSIADGLFQSRLLLTFAVQLLLFVLVSLHPALCLSASHFCHHLTWCFGPLLSNKQCCSRFHYIITSASLRRGWVRRHLPAVKFSSYLI